VSDLIECPGKGLKKMVVEFIFYLYSNKSATSFWRASSLLQT
jgi:hypothetical protein